ncbi:MAG: DNA translocase FtsK, partial [Sphingomonas sp.]|nr:DNA translocase FtsK [Sphingomonas sp.]
MATRAPKRELAPDWRDALRESVRRFLVRSWGALLVALSLAGAIALATHNPNDPSLSTAAGGPPTNWLGSFGAYSSDEMLLLFGLGAALFLPVVAIA